MVDVEFTGPGAVFASRYDVTRLAATAVASATSAVAELFAIRRGEPVRPVSIDRLAACAAFAGEALFRGVGWDLPPIWDPIAGVYRTKDGWIRLHTNYPQHRSAALQALNLPTTDVGRDEVAATVQLRHGADLESAVVDRGGAAAMLQSSAHWLATPPGQAGLAERLRSDSAPPPGAVLPRFARRAEPVDSPLAGVRVLDLTRVIAGPVCTRFLAAYGADVLRIDPPNFSEVPALIPEVTPGKRCAALDLRFEEGRRRFADLVAEADVVVSGLRNGALHGLGFGLDRLRALNPALITARLTAYGWDGPWSGRRGFDSLVQMSCGIAFLDPESAPAPLPVQALDHATGYLLAAAVCRGLASLFESGVPTDIRTSLIATANTLMSMPVPIPPPAQLVVPAPRWPADVFESVSTAWGPARRVRVPGRIEGIEPSWSVEAGPLGRHEPAFT